MIEVVVDTNSGIFKTLEKLTNKKKLNAALKVSVDKTAFKIRKEAMKHLNKKLNIKNKTYIRSNTQVRTTPHPAATIFFKDKNMYKQEVGGIIKPSFKSISISIPTGRLKNKKITKRNNPKSFLKKIGKNKRKRIFKVEIKNKKKTLKPGIYEQTKNKTQRVYSFKSQALYNRKIEFRKIISNKARSILPRMIFRDLQTILRIKLK